MNKFLYYILIPICLYISLVGFLYWQTYNNFKEAINDAAIVIQGLGIIIGAFWAYQKFGWEKKCENIISLKAALMEYSSKHNLSAMTYHSDKDVAGYKIRLLPAYNELSKKIHLSYYVSNKLRKKIFDAIWLTIGNDAGKNYEAIVDNWVRFDKQIEEIYDEFETIISL